MGMYGSPDLTGNSNQTNSKMTTCKICGKEIAKSAKACPSCGAKVKKPIYKKWWFWIIIIFLIAIIGSDNENTVNTGNSTNTTSSSTAENKQQRNATDLYNKILSDYQNGNYERALDRYDEYISKYANIEISGDINVLKSDIVNAIPHVTAEELAKAYDANEVRADELYKNKLIIITGTIDSIGKDILDQTYITLSDGEKYSLKQPQCYFKDESEISKIANLNKGDRITIQGKCTGASVMSASITNCKIK